MVQAPEDDTHTTLGRRFRTPAHPDVLMALGRALFCFLSLEESVTAIVYDAGAASLPVMRGKMAGDKEAVLRELSNTYRSMPDGCETADKLDIAADAFKHARKTVRNQLLHAHPFMAGHDEGGAYVPGLAYTVPDGTAWRTIASGPEDLLDLAEKIEGAITPLAEARRAVQARPIHSD